MEKLRAVVVAKLDEHWVCFLPRNAREDERSDGCSLNKRLQTARQSLLSVDVHAEQEHGHLVWKVVESQAPLQ